VAFERWTGKNGEWCGEVVAVVAGCGLLVLAAFYYRVTHEPYLDLSGQHQPDQASMTTGGGSHR
jgi:hypothetical protein